MENIKIVLKRDLRDKMVNGRLRAVATGNYTCQVIFPTNFVVSTKRGSITENDYKLACLENNVLETVNEIVLNNAEVSFYKGLRGDGTRYFYISAKIYKMFNFSTDEEVDVIRIIWLNNQELNLMRLKGLKISFTEKTLSESELNEFNGENQLNAE